MINRLLCRLFGHRWPKVVEAYARGHATVLSDVRPTLIQRWVEAEVTLECSRCKRRVVSTSNHGVAPYDDLVAKDNALVKAARS